MYTFSGIHQPKSVYKVRTGDIVTIESVVTLDTTENVEIWWKKSHNGVSSVIPIANKSKYTGSTPSEPSLTIIDVGKMDTGSYTCFVSDGVETHQSSTISVLQVFCKGKFYQRNRK